MQRDEFPLTFREKRNCFVANSLFRRLSRGLNNRDCHWRANLVQREKRLTWNMQPRIKIPSIADRFFQCLDSLSSPTSAKSSTAGS